MAETKPTPNTPVARIAAALSGAKVSEQHLRSVLASDLETVAAGVPAATQTERTRDLVKGARGALRLTAVADRAEKTVLVATAHLAELLEAFGS